MFGWGVADFFAKKSIDEIGDIESLVWAHVAGALILLALAGYSLSVMSEFNGFRKPSAYMV